MILLDTNVVSEVMRRDPAVAVIAWLDRQMREDLWLPAIVVFEVCLGFGLVEPARSRWLEARFDLLVQSLGTRIAAFDEAAARAGAELAANRRRRGRRVEVQDTQIAGIALSRGAALCTRNLRHFDDTGLVLHDPWAAGPESA